MKLHQTNATSGGRTDHLARRRGASDVRSPRVTLRGTTSASVSETWATCPTCHHTWRQLVATLGVVHRTQLCTACRRKAAEA